MTTLHHHSASAKCHPATDNGSARTQSNPWGESNSSEGQPPDGPLGIMERENSENDSEFPLFGADMKKQLGVNAVTKPIKLRTPKHLGPDGRRLFRAVMAQFELHSDDRGLHFLTLACEQFDRACDAKRLISEQGAVILDRFGSQKAHPAIVIEMKAQKASNEALREAISEQRSAQRVPVTERRAKVAEEKSNVASLELVRSIIRGGKSS